MNKDIRFLPERLKELRRNVNMTQKEFSEKIGCTMASLSAYENGSKIPPTQTLINIASIFNCSIDWMLGLKAEQYLSAKPAPAKTYSEFIKKLFLLDNDPIPFTKNCNCSSINKDLHDYKGLAFDDPIIKMFLSKWEQTKKLYADGTIDETIYTAWQEKVLRDFHCFIITNSDTWADFFNTYNSFLNDCNFTDYDAIIEALNVNTGFVANEPPHMY